MDVSRKFLSSQVDSDAPKFYSVEAVEPDSKWKVIVDVGGVSQNKKEIIVDDKDGKIVSYKQV